MIGGMDEAAKTQGILHGGCLLKTKAAETGHLMRFALHELAQHGDEIPCKEELRVAGVALEAYMELLRRSPIALSEEQMQQLVDLAQRHLVNLERAFVNYVPKHHQFVHLTDRSFVTHIIHMYIYPRHD